jgi:hypothetical protein
VNKGLDEIEASVEGQVIRAAMELDLDRLNVVAAFDPELAQLAFKELIRWHGRRARTSKKLALRKAVNDMERVHVRGFIDLAAEIAAERNEVSRQQLINFRKRFPVPR